MNKLTKSTRVAIKEIDEQINELRISIRNNEQNIITYQYYNKESKGKITELKRAKELIKKDNIK